MEILIRFWNNFKKSPDIWFFYGFLLTFTLTVRKVVFFYPIRGEFNEYTGIFLYISDILLILTISAWIYTILRNKLSILSILSTVPRGTQVLLTIFSFLVIWSFLSVFWSINQNIAFFRSFKLFEFFLLFGYVIYNVPRGTFFQNILRIIISLGVFHSIIGIWQFFIQHSIGLIQIKESIISTSLPGVAKIILGSEIFIRSYGLFPHPNIFGGFLVFSIILTFLYKDVFHVEQCENRKICSMWNISTFYRLFITLQFTALILTFSKSAIIGLVIALIYICVSRGTQVTYKKNICKKILLISIILILLFIIVNPDFHTLFIKSLEERMLYFNVSRETLNSFTSLIFGIGQGQFVPHLLNFPYILNWQFQPIHNVFLTILTELGIIGLVTFLIFIWKMFHVEQIKQRGNNYYGIYFKAILLAYLFIILFDHYFWDIQQGQILFWMSAALLITQTKGLMKKITP